MSQSNKNIKRNLSLDEIENSTQIQDMSLSKNSNKYKNSP